MFKSHLKLGVLNQGSRCSLCVDLLWPFIMDSITVDNHRGLKAPVEVLFILLSSQILHLDSEY